MTTRLHRAILRSGGGYSFVRALNPAAWFRAGVGQTVTGSGVSTWADQSGNGRDLLQGTDAARPALQADGSVLFNGTSHYLKCNAFTLNQPETVYIAFKQVSWTLNKPIFDGNATNSGILFQSATTPRIRFSSDGGINSTAENANLAIGTYGAVSVVADGASSLVQVNLGTAATGAAGSGNMGGFTLGRLGADATYSNIQVLEVIVAATAHDAPTRARVIQYLAGRHGIAL